MALANITTAALQPPYLHTPSHAFAPFPDAGPNAPPAVHKDPFEEIATRKLGLGPWLGGENKMELTSSALQSAENAFEEAKELDGWDLPVNVAQTSNSGANATSVLQRHVKPLIATEVTSLQKAFKKLTREKPAMTFLFQHETDDNKALLTKLVQTAIDTVHNSPDWTSSSWKDALTMENVVHITTLSEDFRIEKSKETKRINDPQSNKFQHHYDIPLNMLTLFLEIPGETTKTVTPLTRCLMTKASMATGGRLFQAMKELQLPQAALHDKVLDINPKELFYCEPQSPRSEIGVSLVDMFNPVHQFNEAPTGALVRINLRVTNPGSSLQACMPWASELTAGSIERPLDAHQWDAPVLLAWYAFARRKMEELATFYQTEAQVIYTSAYSSLRMKKLRKMMKSHQEMNKCLVAFGLEPQRLTGMDGDPGPYEEEEEEEELTLMGQPNNALTQDLVLEKYNTRRRQEWCTTHDACC